jgi:restriction system protein
MNHAIEELPLVPEGRRYWLVRTSGGRYFEDFVKGRYVAISWNEITKDDTEKGLDHLTNLATKLYNKKSRPNHIANQIYKFAKEIKKGDIVLIPSRKSSEIMFGEVIEDAIYEEENAGATNEKGRKTCPFVKRKKVDWIKKEKRAKLDPYLYRLLYSQHTITNADEYGEFIDRTIYKFYIKGSEANLILEVKKEEGILAKDLFAMGMSILELVDGYGEYTKTDINSNEIEVKLMLNSPGRIQFKGPIMVMTIVGGIILALNGGGVKIESEQLNINVDIHTDGIIKNITEYLDHAQKRKAVEIVLTNSLKNLKAESPEELAKLLGTSNEDTPSDDKSQK